MLEMGSVDLAADDIVQAKVLFVSDGAVHLKTQDGALLRAKVDSPLPLLPGSEASFQVVGMEEGQVVLKLLQGQSPQLNTTQLDAARALSSLLARWHAPGLSGGEKAAQLSALLNQIASGGAQAPAAQTLSPQQLQALGDLQIGQLLEGLLLTLGAQTGGAQASASQSPLLPQAPSNGQAADISAQGGLPGTAQSAQAPAPAPLGALISALFSAFSQESARAQGAPTPVAPQGAAEAQAPVQNGASAPQGTPAAPTEGASSPAAPLGGAQTAQGAPQAPPVSLLPQAAPSPGAPALEMPQNPGAAQVGAQPQQALSELPQAQSSPASAAPPESAPQSAQSTQSTPQAPQSIPTAAPAQTAAQSELPAPVLQMLNQLLPADGDAKAALQQFVADLFVPLEGEQGRELAQTLRRSAAELPLRLAFLEEAVSRAQIGGKEALLSQIQQARGGTELLQQPDRFSYVQLPLATEQGRKTAELYVYRRGGRKQIDPDNATILLALDTEHLGRVESLLSVKQKEATLRISAEHPSGGPFLKEQSTALYGLFAEAGFKLASASFGPLKQPTTPERAEAALEAFSRGKSRGLDVRI